MKRSLQYAFLGLAATVTLAGAPCVIPSAKAQSAPQLETLDLTSAQQTQLRKLREDLRQSLAGILTDEQYVQFQNAFKTSSHIPTAMRTVDNLSLRQKVRVRSALKEFERELSTVLSKEQMAELRSGRDMGPRKPR